MTKPKKGVVKMPSDEARSRVKRGEDSFLSSSSEKNGKAKMFMLIDNSLKHLKILICPFLATAAFYVLLF